MVPYLLPHQVLACITGRRDSTPIHEWFWYDVNLLVYSQRHCLTFSVTQGWFPARTSRRLSGCFRHCKQCTRVWNRIRGFDCITLDFSFPLSPKYVLSAAVEISGSFITRALATFWFQKKAITSFTPANRPHFEKGPFGSAASNRVASPIVPPHLQVQRDIPSDGWPHPHRDKSPRLAFDRVTLPTSPLYLLPKEGATATRVRTTTSPP